MKTNKNTNVKVIAVDFDDFLFKNAYPMVGKPLIKNIKMVKKLQAKGHRIILWSCRDGLPLKRAVKACKAQGLKFVAINDDDPVLKAKWGNNPQSRKIYADLYLDDKGWGISLYELGKFAVENKI